MENEVIIFQAGASGNSGHLSLTPKKFKIPRKTLMGFLAIPLMGLIFISLPFIIGETKYRINLKKQVEVIEGRSKFSYILSPNDQEFELIIPKIAVRTKVLTEVNAGSEQEYNQVLANNAAHARGSNFPGEDGLVYIFGHSTNSVFNINFFNPVFYQVKSLTEGDEIALVYKGKIYKYKVESKKVIEADDLETIQGLQGEDKLVLQTCWPPGTSWKRLLVIAYPITT